MGTRYSIRVSHVDGADIEVPEGLTGVVDVLVVGQGHIDGVVRVTGPVVDRVEGQRAEGVHTLALVLAESWHYEAGQGEREWQQESHA